MNYLLAQLSSDPFWQINIGQVVSWIVLLAAFVAMQERMRTTVKGLGERLAEAVVDLKKLQLEGSPPNSAAITVITATLAQHSVRLEGQQITLNNYHNLKNDIEWIRVLIAELKSKKS